MNEQGNILLADDEETFLEATADLLKEEGYSCSCVSNTHELSSALKDIDYDLLITDLNMPGNRVMEIVEEARSHKDVLPVIVVTGYPSVPTAVESVRLHVLDYLIKPIQYSTLLSSVKRGIHHKQVLEAVRHARAEAAKRTEQLENIERSLSTFGEEVSNFSSVTDFVQDPQETQLHNLLTNVWEWSVKSQSKSGEALEGSVSGGSAIPPKEFFKLREGIFHAVDVLQRTKGSFRSKELADLRKFLQNLLKRTKVES